MSSDSIESMARMVHLVCPHCGHPEMVVVESAGNEAAAVDVVPASGARVAGAEGSSTLEAIRLRRLQSLPKSLPVGGIITPV